MTTDGDLFRALVDAVEGGMPVALATVVRTHRSVPRQTGAKMLVFDDGRQLGTVGGGELERRVLDAATTALSTEGAVTLDIDLVDPAGGDAGVCGGSVSIFVEPIMPPPHIVVVGCGHVGAAVIQLAHWLGCRVTAVDDRDEVAGPDRLGDADVVLSGPLDESLTSAGIDARSHVVVVTRDVRLDVEVLSNVLQTPARTIGVMGSARRWETARQRLLEQGVAEDQLIRVSSPIGLDIGAETPAELALSILAEIVGGLRMRSDDDTSALPGSTEAEPR
jgi:xanthine dehydrogenase accessory factor